MNVVLKILIQCSGCTAMYACEDQTKCMNVRVGAGGTYCGGGASNPGPGTNRAPGWDLGSMLGEY